MGRVIMSGKVPNMVAPSVMPSTGTVLNDFTWAQISQIANEGQAANYFAVGDTKTITIDGTVGLATFSNLEIDAFILGIDHNADIEGTNKIHFSIGKVDGVDVGLIDDNSDSTGVDGIFSMNIEETNVGGWASCYMRSTILGSDSSPTSPTANSLLAALPADLRAVMTPVTKYTDNVGDETTEASAVTATVDYLPLMATFEVDGDTSTTVANSAEQTYQAQYDYYKAGNSALRVHYNDASKTMALLRSPSVIDSLSFCVVHYNSGVVVGQSIYCPANGSALTSPLFCVGGTTDSGSEDSEDSEDSGTTYISFLLRDETGDNTYQVEEGTTWRQFIFIGYTDNLTYSSANGYVCTVSGDRTICCAADGTPCHVSDTIIADGIYYAEYYVE